MDTSWRLIYSKPRHELKLSARLRAMDIETYCPTRKTVRQWSDRKKKIEEPLFSSYVFVRPTTKQMEQIFYVPGFSRFVYWQGKPVLVRDQEIEATRQFLDQVVHDTILLSKFEIGKTVKVGTGPLKNMDGKLLEISNNKAILQIDTLGTLVKAQIKCTFNQRTVPKLERS